MDLCRPFPVQVPHGKKYFFNILDDRSNWGLTFGICLKSDAFSHYKVTEAFLECSNGVIVKAVCCSGEVELTIGQMGAHLTSKGIVVQHTVPYAHQQNGKFNKPTKPTAEQAYCWLTSMDKCIIGFCNIGSLSTLLICDALIEVGLVQMPSSKELGELIFKVGRGYKHGMALLSFVKNGANREEFCEAFVSLDLTLQHKLTEDEKKNHGLQHPYVRALLVQIQTLDITGISITLLQTEVN